MYTPKAHPQCDSSNMAELPQDVVRNVIGFLVVEHITPYERQAKLKTIAFSKKEATGFGRGLFLVCKDWCKILYPLPPGWRVAWLRSRLRKYGH
jgi:hypothetical protein